MLANLSNDSDFSQKLSNWLERVADGLFIDVINFSQMPSDYVAIKSFVKLIVPAPTVNAFNFNSNTIYWGFSS